MEWKFRRLEMAPTIVPMDIPQYHCDGLGIVELCGPNGSFIPFAYQISPSGIPERVGVVRLTGPICALPSALTGLTHLADVPLLVSGFASRVRTGH